MPIIVNNEIYLMGDKSFEYDSDLGLSCFI